MTTKLPVVGRGSTAAATTFVHETIEFVGGLRIHLDGNQKITAGNGTYEAPRPNALSLVNVQDCPGSTPTCRASCYVQGIEKHVADLFELYRENSRTIREVVANGGGQSAGILAEWIRENAGGGFRWHVSGDVFSEAHAEWIAEVCSRSPTVSHWIYTRSFEFLAPLLEVATVNGGALALNLSADRDNYAEAREIADEHGLRVCYMVLGDGLFPEEDAPYEDVQDLPGMRDGDVLFPDYALRGAKGASPGEIRAGSAWWQSLTAAERRMVCPVDMYGKSDGNRCGPCDRCLR